VKELYAGTKVKNLEDYQKMLDMSAKELDTMSDPMVEFAKKLYPDIKKSELEGKKFNGTITKLRPKYAEAVGIYKTYKDAKKLPSMKKMKNAITNLYPDANFTQRFTYGLVKGYKPADAVTYCWKTTLKGIIEKDKDKDEEPFDAPDKLHELYAKKDFGPYADKKTGELIVNYLHTTDITGGNSGSPVMNANGEYIGIAFDGNYEAMTTDWQFDENLTRTISCDARYILFIVDKYSNAQNLLNELEIRK
ncbi:MAG: S46 family peptidase, partial [Calditrichia bacterium]|nr:S46 family peptidase [Calditrichia bacterium]